VHLAKNCREVLFFFEKSSKGMRITDSEKSFKGVLRYRQSSREARGSDENFGRFWEYVVPKEFL
jgi:hypothetical protein